MRGQKLLLGIGAAAFIGVAVAVGGLLGTRGGDTVNRSPAGTLYRGSVPPPHTEAPEFRLRSYRGGSVSLRAQRGKVVVLSFVDTKCTEKCPIVTSMMAQAHRLLAPEDRRQFVPLLMSVDPHVDTPTSVRRFLTRRHALSIDYLIGPVADFRPVWKAYGILPAVDTGDADIHSSDVRVIDREGIWVTTQRAGLDLTPQNLAHDVLVALGRS